MMNEESEHKINKYQQHLFFFVLFWQVGVIQGQTFFALGELLPELRALKSFLSEEQRP